MTNRILPLIAGIFLYTFSIAWAENIPESFERELSEKMGQIEDISFSFEQNTYIDQSTQTVRAEVFFLRPDSMKIIYSAPRRQEIYYQEENLYTFIPEINQATKQKRAGLTDLLGSSASLIFTGGDLSHLKKEYELSFIDEETPLLKASPLKESGYEYLEVSFKNKDLLPEKTVVTAPHLKSVTEFSSYKINTGLTVENFDFAPSGRVNIIEID